MCRNGGALDAASCDGRMQPCDESSCDIERSCRSWDLSSDARSSNSRRSRVGPTFATIAPALTNSDLWLPNAAFALSESIRLVRCMMAQQLPVGLYRSGSVDRPDIVEGQCTSMHLLCHVGQEWVQTMARKATCEGITVDICISIESSAHCGIG